MPDPSAWMKQVFPADVKKSRPRAGEPGVRVCLQPHSVASPAAPAPFRNPRRSIVPPIVPTLSFIFAKPRVLTCSTVFQ